MTAVAHLSLRIPESLLAQLHEEAGRSGFTSVSEYVRRKLAASSPSSRIEQKIDSLSESLSFLREQSARIESRLEETTPSASLPPGHRQVWSEQFGRMVDVDADGREIPPE